MSAGVGRPFSRGHFAAWRRWLTGGLAVVLAVTLVGQPPALAKRAKWVPPAPADVAGVPVTDHKPKAARPAWPAHSRMVRGPHAITWPAPGTATVTVVGKVRAGSLPVWVGPADSAGEPGRADGRTRTGGGPAAVAVTVHDRATTAKAGVQGLLLGLSRADGKANSANLAVEVDYSGFAAAYGGDWAARLRLVQRPTCAMTTPELAACQATTPLPSANDTVTSKLSAQVPVSAVGTLLAVEGEASGDNGDYTATGLSQAGTWQVSNQTGDFSWSYALRMPPALGGPAPSVSLAYSSGSVDGRTGATNNQGGWVGDGWESWPGFIERRYASCADDNPDHKTGDQCWFNDNATLSMNGHAGELIKDGSVWRLKDDDGTKVEKLTSSARSNGDNDDEYWKVTTVDGAQYFFGYHKLPGWTSGKAVTDSTWTVPVFGNNSGEPCHNADFAQAHCTQAWRWNLDYVVDPNGNSMGYFYRKETGAYARDNTPSQRTTYDRGGYLTRIEYGMRNGAEYSQAAPLRVLFDTAERCLSGCWTGAAWTSDPVTSAWPDTPWDQYCKAEPCTEQGAPTFWSARRLTKVTAQVRNAASTYRDVESWTLRHEFVNAGTGEGTPMWLRGVTRTGHVTTAGGSVVSDPEITFDPGAEPLPNRVDGPDDQRTELNRWRIKAVHTESGGDIIVTYSTADCTRATLPTPESNTKRCMPVKWDPPDVSGTDPVLDWFHKYVVTQVDLNDMATDQLNTTTYYDYLDTPAWHYTDDEITKDKLKTWGDWRGYGRVRVRQGTASGQQTAVEYRYLRGMDGDHLPSGTRDVHVDDSWGGSIEDHEALRGFPLQEIVYNGPTGAEVSSTRNEPWRHGPTATRTRNGVTTNAWKVNTGQARERTALEAGGYRYTKTVTDYNNDGLPVAATEFGDENATGDETCTRTTYARNDATWMIDRVSQEETLSVTCGAASTPADPTTVLARTRHFYDSYVDDSSFGQAPTDGNEVRTEELDRFTGSTPVYVPTARNVFDANGRITQATDARGYATTTVYTTTNGGLVTQTVATNALSHRVTTLKEPAWDLPTRVTDPNGTVTELTYDGLGRLTQVWLPGRDKATQTPSTKFTYLLRSSGGPTAVTTESLLPTGTAYKKSINLYDGFLRLRQNQTDATEGGRLITETFYNTMGEVAWTSAAYYDDTNAPPSTTLGTPQGQIPSITQHVYDGAGRETAKIFKALGVEKWRTTTGYGGDRLHTTPPAGGIATTAVTNVHDETVELRQYHTPADVGSNDPATYDKTAYTYDLEGQLTKVVDAAGNQWQYVFDIRNRQTTAVDPDKGTTTSTYDDAGNVLTTTSPVGTTTATLAYTYDAIGRKTSVRDGSPTGSKRAEWVYDATPIMPAGTSLAKGKLSKSIRWVGSTAYESRVDGYDTAGRPTSTSVAIPSTEGALCAAASPSSCVYTTTVTYKPNGSVFRTTLPQAANLAAETLTYGYTDIGEPAGLLSASQIYVYSVSYDKIGHLTQRQLGAYGSRVAVTSTFDEPTRRLTATNVVPELKPEAADWRYLYDDVGDITKISDAPAGQTADTQCFGYDYLRRLKDAWTPSSGSCTSAPTVSGLGGPARYWHSWEYTGTAGLTGSRTKEIRHASTGDTSFTYTYPAQGATAVRPHTVSQVRMDAPGQSWTHGYTYDNAGNTATRLSDAGNQQTLTWDAEGHLASLVEAGKTTRYVYDADGTRLIAKNGDGSKVLYLPNGTEVKIAAGSSTATATRYYTHKDTTIAVRTAASLDWTVGDHQGSTQLTVKATTLAVSKKRTLPFGGERTATPSGWPAGYDKGFVGGTKDPTGLTHLGAREYDPAIGRFVSVDPVIDPADPQQLHPYAYAANNPVTMSDPDGQWPKFLKKAASAVASAATTVGNATANVVTSTVESIKEDPLKFATGVAVGIAATVAVGALCAATAGVGCVILAGAVAGAAAAGAEYGVDIAQGEREFSVGDLAKEMAIGGAAGAVGAGAGIVGGKVLSKARGAFGGGGKAADEAVDLADDAASAGRRADDVIHDGSAATGTDASGGSRQITALGAWNDIKDFLGKPGYNVLNLPWKGPGRWNWTRNKRFIDDAIDRGDKVRAYTNPHPPRTSPPGGRPWRRGNVFDREVKYVESKGYNFVKHPSYNYWKLERLERCL